MKAISNIFVFILLGFIQISSMAQSRKELAYRLNQAEFKIQNLEEDLRISKEQNKYKTQLIEKLMDRLNLIENQMHKNQGRIEKLEFEKNGLKKEISDLIKSNKNRNLSVSKDNHYSQDQKSVTDSRQTSNTPIDLLNSKPDSSTKPDIENKASDQKKQAPEKTSPNFNESKSSNSVQDFQQAKRLLKEGEFIQAGKAFETLLSKYSTHPDRAEAYYWLGEIYYIQSYYKKAASSYIQSLKQDMQTKYAPEAMIMLGSSLSAMGEKQEGCKTLKEFFTQYPNVKIEIKEKANAEIQRAKCTL